MPKFCSECGASLPSETAKFCAECGASVGAPEAATRLATADSSGVLEDEREVWTGTPDPALSPIAAKTTTYLLTTERLRVNSGVVGRKGEQLELYRVVDVQVRRGPVHRTRGRGDVIVKSKDATTPNFKLESVREPDRVAEKIRQLVREARARHGIDARELLF
jgi:hypothetical protein